MKHQGLLGVASPGDTVLCAALSLLGPESTSASRSSEGYVFSAPIRLLAHCCTLARPTAHRALERPCLVCRHFPDACVAICFSLLSGVFISLRSSVILAELGERSLAHPTTGSKGRHARGVRQSCLLAQLEGVARPFFSLCSGTLSSRSARESFSRFAGPWFSLCSGEFFSLHSELVLAPLGDTFCSLRSGRSFLLAALGKTLRPHSPRPHTPPPPAPPTPTHTTPPPSAR
jgi:hypothetical protein